MKAKRLPLNDNVKNPSKWRIFYISIGKIKKTEYNIHTSLYSFFFSGTGEFIEIPITSL